MNTSEKISVDSIQATTSTASTQIKSSSTVDHDIWLMRLLNVSNVFYTGQMWRNHFLYHILNIAAIDCFA